MEAKTEIVTQYLSDMHVLEKHIQEALEKQVATTKDRPEIHDTLRRYVATTRGHVERLEQRMQELGDQDRAIDKAKELVSSLFGQAAGAIDTIRTHRASKDLRDDYAAASLAAISYVMLKTTALACGDAETAGLAEAHLGDKIKMLRWLAQRIPHVVVSDLQEERDVPLDTSAATRVARDPQLAELIGGYQAQHAAA